MIDWRVDGQQLARAQFSAQHALFLDALHGRRVKRTVVITRDAYGARVRRKVRLRPHPADAWTISALRSL